MNRTIAYYDEHAEEYAASAATADLSALYGRFVSCIPKGGSILDLGCGSGRDTKQFLAMGYQVTAMDGSAEMCRIASDCTGIPVVCRRFEELTEDDAYDGIWACASLLHIPEEQLPEILDRICRALKDDGILYASFKKGRGESTDGGRFYQYYDEEELRRLFCRSGSGNGRGSFCGSRSGLWCEPEILRTADSTGRSNVKWINVFVRKG
jgi:SAM-dependent methyltransferase